MNIVTLEVRSLADTLSDVALAMETGVASSPHLAFETPELLFKVLTAKRWELLRTMAGAGPMTIREAARRVGRDIKAVHGDVTALLNTGILDKKADGKIVFPFDAVHVDFMLKVA